LPFTTNAQRVQRSDKGLYGIAVTKSNGNIRWLAKPKYSKIEKNYNGSFSVCNQYSRWGVVTSAGKEVIPCTHPSKASADEAYKYYIDPSLKRYASNTPSVNANSQYSDFTLNRDYGSYIKSYVEEKINAWQKKGEFEKTSDYQERVTEDTRKSMVLKLTQDACEECLNRIQNKELRMSLGEYDADNESFLIETEIGKFVIQVPISKAPQFKKNWSKITSRNTYDIANGKVILRNAIFSLNGKQLAMYSDQTHALYAQANVQYNFDPIEVPLESSESIRQPQIVQNNIQIGKSDVDINVPSSGIENKLTFALIFANEKYREESNVDFAYNDGTSIGKYFSNTLGVPQKNIHVVYDATKNDMVREVDWLKNVASVYADEDINLIVYYAGHGVPNETDGTAYLIPIDGVGSNIKTLYPLAEFYDELGSIKSKSTVLFLDACFSGSLRGSGMLASARGIALKAKQVTPKSNMVVISAATGDETAWPYKEKGHGLFTYYLLKKLQTSKGNVSLGQLADYVKTEVGKQSVVSNSKRQTPTVNVSANIANSWQNIKLK
jgi:hypothetical protein